MYRLRAYALFKVGLQVSVVSTIDERKQRISRKGRDVMGCSNLGSVKNDSSTQRRLQFELKNSRNGQGATELGRRLCMKRKHDNIRFLDCRVSIFNSRFSNGRFSDCRLSDTYKITLQLYNNNDHANASADN